MLVGKHLIMSFISNKTDELCNGFHPLAQKIGYRVYEDKLA